MKVINFKNTALSETETNTLNTFFSVLDEEGRKFVGLALIADHTVVMVDLNKAANAEEAIEQALHYMEENLNGMPDFGPGINDNLKIAWCEMYGGLIMTQVPYLEEFATVRNLSPYPFLGGRQEALDACEKKEVRSIAWWDSTRELKEKCYVTDN